MEKELISKRICELLLEELLMELAVAIPCLTPYNVVGVERKPITARKVSKTIDEVFVQDRLVKGTAILKLSTLFIEAIDNHRVEVELRLREKNEEGRVRIRCYTGNRIISSDYIDVATYELKSFASKGVLYAGTLRNSDIVQGLVTKFEK